MNTEDNSAIEARRQAAAEALETLEGLDAEIDPTLIAKLKGLAGLEQGEDAAEKSEAASRERLAKSASQLEDLERGISPGADAERLRKQVRKAREAVEMEYLAHMSPAGARTTVEAREQARRQQEQATGRRY